MNKMFSKVLLFFIVLTVALQIYMPMTVHAAGAATGAGGGTGEGGEFDYGVVYNDGGTLTRGSAYMDEEGQTGVWNKIFTEYKGVIVGVTGIGTLTMVCLFIFNFMKLGQSAGNPQLRSAALTGLLWTGLAAAGLGGVTIFVGFSSNLLKGK